jgi:hypothetical protein
MIVLNVVNSINKIEDYVCICVLGDDPVVFKVSKIYCTCVLEMLPAAHLFSYVLYHG